MAVTSLDLKTLKMQCCVPFCKTTKKLVDCGSEGITFHELPSEVHLRAAWLRALGNEETHLPDSAVVCSQHFLSDDMYETESGLRHIRTGAIPSTVQVCMMCLDAHSKLFLMKKYKLEEAYENLVGQPRCDQGNLKQTLCVQCAQRLVNFSKFRDKSLRARSIMMKLVKKNKLITIQHMELMDDVKNKLKPSIVKTLLKPDHCDLYINHSDEDTALDSSECNVFGAVALKNKHSHDPMSIDETQTQHNSEVSNEDNTANNYNSNTVVLKEEYITDDSVTLDPKQFNDTLLVKPSTSKDAVDGMAPMKYEITFECTICFEEFADEDTYNYHMAMHIEQNQSPDEDSTTAAHYAHSSVAPLPCGHVKNIIQHAVSPSDAIEPANKKVKVYDRCAKTKTSASDGNKECEELLNTVSYHNEIQYEEKSLTGAHVDEMLKCQFCQYKTKYKVALGRHMRRTHTGAGKNLIWKFVCDVCEYKCTQTNVFVEHMRIHTGEKPFSCDKCEHKFARKSDFMRHMKLHIGKKPYSCEFCAHKFARNSDLVRHKRTHTGEKPYCCEFCDHRFSRNSDLVNHKRTHTGEKPYACNLCDYKCARNSELFKHNLKNHTRDAPNS